MGLARASAGSAADSAPKTRRFTCRWEPKKSGAARFAGPNRSTAAAHPAGRVRVSAGSFEPGARVGESGQRGEVPARAGAPDADPLRGETGGRRVGPPITDGGVP